MSGCAGEAYDLCMRDAAEPPGQSDSLVRWLDQHDESAVLRGWYVYEDFVTHEAVVHRSDWVHCNHGQGHGAGRNERENTWHGEFSSEQSARAARIDPRSYVRNCRVCIG